MIIDIFYFWRCSTKEAAQGLILQHANTELTRRVFDQYRWEQNFLNKNFNVKVEIFNKTILNTHSNIITHETVILNDRDPPWFNSKIKSLLNAKHEISW